MTQDEIIEMWKNSGDLEILGMPYNKIEAFAKLVAAKHDPKIAIADAYRAGVDSGIAAEREACAKVCDYLEREMCERTVFYSPEKCADAIRARGEA